MRIPTSLIVMSLLTAVPFGLAIRDTVTGEQSRLADDDELDVRQEREWVERHERELAREAATRWLDGRERERERLHAKLDQLYGARARMGSLLRGIDLGPASPHAIDTMVRHAERISRRDSVHVELDYTRNGVTSVNIDVGADGICEVVGDKLTQAWGPSTRGAWLDPETHTRAHFDRESCTLTFQRYLEPADWVAAVPFEMVGQPAKKLLAMFPDATDDGDTVDWYQPSVGYGGSATVMFATVNGGRITAIHASTDTDYDSLIAIRDAVSTKLAAKATRGGMTSSWAWKWRKVPVTLLQPSDSDRFLLDVGQESWD